MPRLLYLMIGLASSPVTRYKREHAGTDSPRFGLASSPNHCMLRKPQGQGILLEWMRHSPVWRPRQTICHVAKTARLGGFAGANLGAGEIEFYQLNQSCSSATPTVLINPTQR